MIKETTLTYCIRSRKQKTWHKLVSVAQMAWIDHNTIAWKTLKTTVASWVTSRVWGRSKDQGMQFPRSRKGPQLLQCILLHHETNELSIGRSHQTWHAVEASVSDLEPQCPVEMCGHIQCDDKSIWQGSNSGSTGVIRSLVSVREWMVIMSIYICDPDHQISSHDLFPVCGPKEWCLWSAYLSSD